MRGDGAPRRCRALWVVGAAFGIVLLAPALALADNCSSPSDCWGTAAAAAGAAVGAGAAAAAAAAGTKWEKGECEPERNRVERSELARDFYQKEVEKVTQQLQPIQAQAEALKQLAIAQGAVAMAEAPMGPPGLAESVAGLVGTLTAGLQGVTGATPREFFTSLGGYYQLMGGQIGAVSGMAQQGAFPATTVFLTTLQQLQQISLSAAGLLTMLEHYEAKLQEWKEEVEKAHDSLAECEAKAARAVV